MPKYLVKAKSTTWYQIEVEAKDADEAIHIAGAADGTEFETEDDYPDWEVAPDGREDVEEVS